MIAKIHSFYSYNNYETRKEISREFEYLISMIVISRNEEDLLRLVKTVKYDHFTLFWQEHNLFVHQKEGDYVFNNLIMEVEY